LVLFYSPQRYNFSSEGITMRDELFKELQNSIKESGRILKGKKKPGREFNFTNPDPKQIR
jgi:hypothetical protein